MADAYYNGRDLTQVNALEYAIDLGAVRLPPDGFGLGFPIPVHFKPQRVNETSTRVFMIWKRGAQECKLCAFIVDLNRKELHIEEMFNDKSGVRNYDWVEDAAFLCAQRGRSLMGVIMDVIWCVLPFNDIWRVTLYDRWHPLDDRSIDSTDVQNYAGYVSTPV